MVMNEFYLSLIILIFNFYYSTSIPLNISNNINNNVHLNDTVDDKNNIELLKFKINSTNLLFEPITVFINKINNDTKNEIISTTVYVDYRPFTVLPMKKNLWTRMYQSSSISVIDEPESFDLPCFVFIHKGVYRIHLEYSNDTYELSLNSSTILPTVNFREDSIFPYCSGDYLIKWIIPKCFIPDYLSTQFRIRILAILDSPENLPEEYNYVEEIPIIIDKNNDSESSITTIPCSQFDIIYKKYCFELVTVNDKTHLVDDWSRKCVYTENINRIDGNWANWSSWTLCSKPCGNGIKKRFRTCTNPSPNSRGKFCIGSSIDTSTCNTNNCTSSDDNKSLQSEALSSNNHTNMTSDSLTCHCGCSLHHQHHGYIYASRQLKCKNETLLWTLPRQESTKVQLQILKEDDKGHFFDVFRILKGQSMEIVWSSESSKQLNLTIPMDDDVFFLFETRNKKNSLNDRIDGYYVEFKYIKDLPKLISLSREYSAQLGLSWAFGHCTSTTCQNTVVFILIIAVIIVLFTLIALPPLVCSYATQQYHKRRGTTGSQMSEALLTSLSQKMDTEMYRSNETESTKMHDSEVLISNQEPYSVAKRSIGIQLSVQSTPRTSRSPAKNSSFPSIDELEYDYYDPVVPGSILRPYLVSEVDIDQIIQRETSGWLKSPRETPQKMNKCDVTTQIDSM